MPARQATLRTLEGRFVHKLSGSFGVPVSISAFQGLKPSGIVDRIVGEGQ